MSKDSLKLLIDMNLSPRWCEFFKQKGILATHWSEVGKANAKDSELMLWAKTNEFMVFTNDLDFGSILASTNDSSPSVIQVRTQALSPEDIGASIEQILTEFTSQLIEGVLIIVDTNLTRVRLLPLKP